MPTFNRQQLGKTAEVLAGQFLQAKGLRLLVQNYYCFHGEIDLIMQDGDDIVFVEVRHRSRIDYGNALESINYKKIRKIGMAARHFLQRKNWFYKKTSRFDIIAIHPAGGKMQLEWVKNAFAIDIE